MKEESNKAKEIVIKIKTYVQEMPKKRKIIAAALLLAIIVAAVVITVALHGSSKEEYVSLYKGLDQQETSEIYVALKQKGADVKMNDAGEITVPQDQYDIWLLQMAAEGYPQSTLTYDVFSKNTGLTTTESEKQTWLINQLQDRIQQTLKKIKGVNNAVVTITAPQTSEYVWQQASDKKTATASVLLTLSDDAALSADQVNAIKNLVSKSVDKLEPANVTVVNANTGMELNGTGEGEDKKGITTTQNLSLEQEVQQQIEENVERLLSARYGQDGVVAAAKVTLNYDAMMTETMTPTQTQDGKGYMTDYSEKYGINGTANSAGGVVGEEDNTDIPGYAYTNSDQTGGMTNYQRNMKYDYGYIKTQVEKGNAVLSRATISVMVNESNLDATRTQELISLISNATDIAPTYIAVSAMNTAALNVPTTQPQPAQTENGLPIWVYIAIGAGALVLILIIVLVIARSRKNKSQEELFEEGEDEYEEEYEEGEDLDTEIDEYKRQLEEAARASIDLKDKALTTDIRDFAKENPEITANLLRTWMREEE